MSDARSIQTYQPAVTTWAMQKEEADMIAKSDFLPQSYYGPNGSPRNYAAAAAKVLAVASMGRELQIPPWASINNINVINGKPTISPQLMLSMIYRSGLLRDLRIEMGDTQVSVIMWRRGYDSAHTETFTMDDAKRLGLAGKDNWQKQPKTMMKWRAVAACARIVVPDVILGMYTEEEMGANVIYNDETGAVEHIEEAVIVEDPPKSSSKPASETASAANVGSDKVVHLFQKGADLNNGKLIQYWTEKGYVDKAKKVDWKKALEETRAATGQDIKGFSELTGFETPDAFFERMDAFFASLVNDAPKAAPKNAPKKKFEWTDDLVRQTEDWISEHFGLSSEYALLKGTHGTIREFATQDEVRADIIRCALADTWAVESSAVTYDGKGLPINFVTAIGNVRFYSRTALAEMLGEKAFAEVGLDALKDDSKGKFPLNKPLRLEWNIDGEPGHEYMIATSVMTTDEIPF